MISRSFFVDILGCVYTVHPNNAECYYLRMLLINVKGPTSFANIRTVDGVVCQTFREACQKLQLLENNQHWKTTLMSASVKCHPRQIRTLFGIILTTCAPSNPRDLWEKFKKDISEDILHRVRVVRDDNSFEYSNSIFNEYSDRNRKHIFNHQQQSTHSTWHKRLSRLD